MAKLAKEKGSERSILVGVQNTTEEQSPSSGGWHPSGRAGHGRGMQILRVVAFAVYFNFCCFMYVIPNLFPGPVAIPWHFSLWFLVQASLIKPRP